MYAGVPSIAPVCVRLASSARGEMPLLPSSVTRAGCVGLLRSLGAGTTRVTSMSTGADRLGRFGPLAIGRGTPSVIDGITATGNGDDTPLFASSADTASASAAGSGVDSGSSAPLWRARPKSITRTLSSRPTITLSGLKSRWTSPASCAAARPRPAATKTRSTSRHSRGARVQPVADGVTVDELHRDEHRLVERADVVDHDDVGVRELGDRLRLAQQARASLRRALAGAGARAQQLDRDLAIQLGIVRGVDVAHPAAPDQPQHHVAPDRSAAGQNVRVVDCSGDPARVASEEKVRAGQSAGSILGFSAL